MSNFDDNKNNNSSLSETAIIGLPRLETILDDIDQPDPNEIVQDEKSLTDQIPVSLLEIYQTQPLDQADLNTTLEKSEPQVENKDLNLNLIPPKTPKKKRRRRRTRRSALILNETTPREEKTELEPEMKIQESPLVISESEINEDTVKIKIQEKTAEIEPISELDEKLKIKIFEGEFSLLGHETLSTESELVADQLEYDEVILRPFSREDLESTQAAPDISSFFNKPEEEPKEEKLQTLITPKKRRRKRRPSQTHQLKTTETNLKPLPGITLDQNLIFSNIPERLMTAGLVLYNNLTRQMQKDGALRVEHLMTVLGSLAGYSSQAGAREKMMNRLKLQEDQVFSIIETVDGSKYYFSDTIDRTLQKDKHSIWYMAATAALKLTGRVDTNINEIVSYNIRNLGKKSFGIPRITKNLRSGNLPEYYVKHLWVPIQKGLERFTDNPLDWPVIFGVALQRALIVTKDVLDPNISLNIAMESAVPASIMDVKPINPNELPERENNEVLIEKLRSDIRIIRKTLEIPGMPEEQRESLLAELSDKNEQLFLLLN